MTDPSWTYYNDRAAWKADAKYTAPDFSMGASSWAKALEVSPHGGPWDLFIQAHPDQEAIAGDDEDDGTEVMQRGQEWEPILVKKYEKLRNRGVDSRLCRVVDPSRPWHRPSPDGRSPERGSDGIIEVKTDNNPRHWGPDGTIIRDWVADRGNLAIPSYYATQGFSLLEASGVDWVDFVVGLPCYVRLVDVRIIRLYRQPKIQAALAQRVSEFRDRYLVGGEHPPIDGSHPANGWLSSQQRSKDLRDPDANQIAMLLDLEQAKRQLQELKQRERKLQNQLIEAAGESAGFLWRADGRQLTARVVTRSGSRSLSLKRLESAKPEWVEQLELDGVIRTSPPSAHIRFYEKEIK
jgi:hypothetical protein